MKALKLPVFIHFRRYTVTATGVIQQNSTVGAQNAGLLPAQLFRLSKKLGFIKRAEPHDQRIKRQRQLALRVFFNVFLKYAGAAAVHGSGFPLFQNGVPFLGMLHTL